MAIRRISFLDSFLSGGCVGTSFLNSANAPETFCCRHLSRVFVKNFRTTGPFRLVGNAIGKFDAEFEESGSGRSEMQRYSRDHKIFRH